MWTSLLIFRFDLAQMLVGVARENYRQNAYQRHLGMRWRGALAEEWRRFSDSAAPGKVRSPQVLLSDDFTHELSTTSIGISVT